MDSELLTPLPRGVLLVEEVIQRLSGNNDTPRAPWLAPWPQGHPVPVPTEQLEMMAFPDGRPLSPGLRRWLSFDGSWLGWFDDPARPVLRPEPLTAYMGPAFAIFLPLLSGDLYRLPGGDCTTHYLYVGQPNAACEYPILFTDIDDRYLLGLAFPGFDLYLAWAMGTHERLRQGLEREQELQQELRVHERLNLKGYRHCELFGDALLSDGSKGRWHDKGEDEVLAYFGLSPEEIEGGIADAQGPSSWPGALPAR